MGFTYLYTYVAVEEVPSKMLTPTSTTHPGTQSTESLSYVEFS